MRVVRAALAGVLALTAFSEAQAQGDAPAPVRKLPRPGYEAKELRQGSFVLSPTLRLQMNADSNIFSTSTNEESDVVYFVEPSVGIARSTRSLTLDAEAHARIRRFVENSLENTNSYGARAGGVLRANRAQSADFSISYDRTFQSRDDPEDNNSINLPPVNVDNASADIGYTYRPGRFGIGASASAAWSDYRRASDDERDLTRYRAALRGLIGVSSRIDLFVEGYGAWRDFRLPVDLSGVNRDGETYGGNVGFALDFTDKLVGGFSVGYYSTTFDDVALNKLTGIGVNGQLRWSPAPRTELTLNAFRGDVATNRAGASGRVDSRVGLSVVQELRHNLRARASAGYRRRLFRTVNPNEENDLDFSFGAEFMLNRHVALDATYSFRMRDATIPTDDFESHVVGLALIARY